MVFFGQIKNKIRYWLATLLLFQFIFCWFSLADDEATDLLWNLFSPAKESEIIIIRWNSKQKVWEHVFKWYENDYFKIDTPKIQVGPDNQVKCRLWKCYNRCSVIGTILTEMGITDLDLNDIDISDIINDPKFGTIAAGISIAGVDGSSVASKIGDQLWKVLPDTSIPGYEGSIWNVADISIPGVGNILDISTPVGIASCRLRDRATVKVSAGISAWIEKEPPMIVRITRMLLIVTIALAVTMILYNWMMYIVNTWQWKEGKPILKNIAYIIVWILIAIFSVIIIRIAESIPTTISDSDELPLNGYEQDREAISHNKWISVWASRRKTMNVFDYF